LAVLLLIETLAVFITIFGQLPYSSEEEAQENGTRHLDDFFEVVALNTRDLAEAKRRMKHKYLATGRCKGKTVSEVFDTASYTEKQARQFMKIIYPKATNITLREYVKDSFLHQRFKQTEEPRNK
jgi:hypothetical protein